MRPGILTESVSQRKSGRTGPDFLDFQMRLESDSYITIKRILFILRIITYKYFRIGDPFLLIYSITTLFPIRKSMLNLHYGFLIVLRFCNVNVLLLCLAWHEMFQFMGDPNQQKKFYENVQSKKPFWYSIRTYQSKPNDPARYFEKCKICMKRLRKILNSFKKLLVLVNIVSRTYLLISKSVYTLQPLVKYWAPI